MGGMPEPEFEKTVTFKTTAKAQRAVNRLVAELKASNRVGFRGEEVTKEAVINAIWVWLEEFEFEALEEAMVRSMPRLEAYMRGEEPAPAGKPEYLKPLGGADLTRKASGAKAKGDKEGADSDRVPKRRR